VSHSISLANVCTIFAAIQSPRLASSVGYSEACLNFVFRNTLGGVELGGCGIRCGIEGGVWN
jgi:hypothetical protein